MRKGQGQYKFKNGNEYNGDLAENVPEGIGRMLYINEGDYFGRWKNGKKNGEGVYNYAKTKDIYSGSWLNGKKHGNGTYIFDETRCKVSRSCVNSLSR